MTPETRAARLTGTVVSCHLSADKYGGSYGEIRSDGDKPRHYVWSAGNVYRNRSHLTVGVKVEFEPVGYSYANNIDQTDKERW